MYYVIMNKLRHQLLKNVPWRFLRERDGVGWVAEEASNRDSHPEWDGFLLCDFTS